MIITDSYMPVLSGLAMIKEINKLIESYQVTQKALFTSPAEQRQN